jgi:hypothetical protein
LYTIPTTTNTKKTQDIKTGERDIVANINVNSGKKDGKGGAEIVKKNNKAATPLNSGISERPPLKAVSCRVPQVSYNTLTRKKRHGEHRPWKTIIRIRLLNLIKLDASSKSGITIMCDTEEYAIKRFRSDWSTHTRVDTHVNTIR